jgi:hypothetical protein
MNLNFLLSHLDSLDIAEAAHPLSIVGVYSDLPAYMLATNVLCNVARNCSAVCKLDAAWWSYEALASASEREGAARAAAEADMIWCSTHACEALPERVTKWVEAWLPQQQESNNALVALLRCPRDYQFEKSPSRAYLIQAAQSTSLQLFVRRFNCDCRQSLRFPHRASSLPDNLPVVEKWPNSHQIRGWGINE